MAAAANAAPCAQAVFLPACENFLDGIRTALAEPSHRPECRLYTDGRRFAWLPRRMPGWFPAPRTVAIKEAA